MARTGLKIINATGLEYFTPAQQVIRNGFAEVVAVSMGAEGAWLISADEKYYVEAPRVEKKSTVGAGDSMVAGIAYALEKKLSLPEAIRWGVACGTAATMNSGTQLFPRVIY